MQSKINNDFGWKPSVDFKNGLGLTIDWYLENRIWLENIKSGKYTKYYSKHYNL